MTPEVQDLLLEVALNRQLSEEDREHLAAAATVERFDKGEAVYEELAYPATAEAMEETHLELASEMGRTEAGGVFIPMTLSRQELADLMGTTVETSIRIMSRWGKQGVVQTEKNGFLVTDRMALEQVSVD